MKKIIRYSFELVFMLLYFQKNVYSMPMHVNRHRQAVGNAICDIAIAGKDDNELFVTIERETKYLNMADIENIKNKFILNDYNKRTGQKILSLVEAVRKYKLNLKNYSCCSSVQTDGDKLHDLYIMTYVGYLSK